MPLIGQAVNRIIPALLPWAAWPIRGNFVPHENGGKLTLTSLFRNYDLGLFWTNFGKLSENAFTPIKNLELLTTIPLNILKMVRPPSVAPLKTRDPLDVFDTFSNYN